MNLYSKLPSCLQDKELFETSFPDDPVQYHYTDCIWCGSKKTLLLYIPGQNLLRTIIDSLWGYCVSCQKVLRLGQKEGRNQNKEALWLLYQETVENFKTLPIPNHLSAVLGLSYRLDDPLKKSFFDGFAGYVPNFNDFYWRIRDDIGITHITAGGTRQDPHASHAALVFPICSRPGYIAAFQIITHKRFKTIFLQTVKYIMDEAKIYVKLQSLSPDYPIVHYRNICELIEKHTIRSLLESQEPNITCGWHRGVSFYKVNTGFGFPSAKDLPSLDDCL